MIIVRAGVIATGPQPTESHSDSAPWLFRRGKKFWRGHSPTATRLGEPQLTAEPLNGQGMRARMSCILTLLARVAGHEPQGSVRLRISRGRIP